MDPEKNKRRNKKSSWNKWNWNHGETYGYSKGDSQITMFPQYKIGIFQIPNLTEKLEKPEKQEQTE